MNLPPTEALWFLSLRRTRLRGGLRRNKNMHWYTNGGVMKLDDQSQMIIDGLNRSGVLPFSRFTPAEARNEILKLRVERPAIPTHEMSSVAEEFVTTPDGSFKVRILTPRQPQSGELMPAVIYYHGGGFFAGGLDETSSYARSQSKPTSWSSTSTTTSRRRRSSRSRSTMLTRPWSGS